MFYKAMIIDMILGDCFKHLLLTASLLTIIDSVNPLNLVELRVPEHVPLGTRAHLSCRWQLDPDDVLYSVKWYKDGKEFFRHVPRDVEPRRKFPLPGVNVEQEFDSLGSSIALSKATFETSGRYRCEVSGERPLFQTVSDHADMEVVVLPTHGPSISGLRPRYRIGDQLRVNCTSGPSRPPIRLSWYINGEPASIDAVSSPIYRRYEDQKTTTVLLTYEVTEDDFKANGLKVKCLATFGTIYWRSNEESALLEKEKVIYNASEPIWHETYLWADQDLSNLGHVPTCSLSDLIIGVIIVLVGTTYLQ